MDTNQETKVIDLGNRGNPQDLDETKIMEPVRDNSEKNASANNALEQALKATSEKLSQTIGTPGKETPPAEEKEPSPDQQEKETEKQPADAPEEKTEDDPEKEEKVSLDELSDKEFLALYGDGSPKKKKKEKKKKVKEKADISEDPDKTGLSEEKKASGKKRDLLGPLKKIKNDLNDENIDEEKAKSMVNILGIVGGITFIVVVSLIAAVIYAQFSSFSSQYNQAVEYENAGDLARAAGCYEKAIDAAGNKNDRIRSRMALANLYLDQHSDNNASFYFEQVVDIDGSNEEAIKKLLSIYETNNDMSAIVALAEKASEDEKTQALFADYLLNQPVFNYKSGTYDELLTVEIEAGEAERIYYTTDDTEATEMSKLYTGPIQLGEGHTVFHAMAVSATGLMSQNIEVNYEIIAAAPETPKISPNSGTYRELTKIHVDIPDGCRAYYTLDGNPPTAESPEYTEDLQLPMGNHIFSVIFINQNGIASQVATKVYDFIFSAPVTKNEAVSKVIDGLVEQGELLDSSGEAADPSLGTAEFRCNDILTINDAQFYRVDKIYSGGGAFGSYAVEINTGAVFSLLDNNGNYTLVGF